MNKERFKPMTKKATQEIHRALDAYQTRKDSARSGVEGMSHRQRQALAQAQNT